MSVCGRVAQAALMAATMAGAGPEGNRGKELFSSLLGGLSEIVNQRCESLKNQLFNSALMRLSNSSKLCSPFNASPLMKKNGVEFTFKTSLAYFWSAAILSS